MKCLLVYNPVSGTSKKLVKKLPYIEKALTEKFGDVTIRPTTYAGEAKKIAKESCGKYDVLIVSGGDGTYSEILNGLGENKNTPVLGYIPSGSCGDVAYNHRIPHNIKRALKVILKGNKKEVDLCKINDTYFSYIAGIGTYTAGIYNTDQKLKRKIGKAAYYLGAVKETFNIEPLNVTITVGKRVNKIKDALLVLVLNTRSVGGFPYLNYMSDMSDGKVEVLVIKKDTFNTPVNIWRLFAKGVENFKDNPNVKLYKGSNIKVETDSDVIWNVDGDKSEYKNIEVNVLKKKICMFVGD